MTTKPIRLICNTCRRGMDYERTIDPTIPANVAFIFQKSCDDCWDGDREEEIWYDAGGHEVSQARS
jgi:hypothetical protein